MYLLSINDYTLFSFYQMCYFNLSSKIKDVFHFHNEELQILLNLPILYNEYDRNCNITEYKILIN